LLFILFFCSLSFLLAEGKSLLFLVLYCFVVELFSSKETLLPQMVYLLSHLFESLATLFGVWLAKSSGVMGWTTDTHTQGGYHWLDDLPLRTTTFFSNSIFCWDAWGCCSFSLFVAVFHDLDDCGRYKVW